MQPVISVRKLKKHFGKTKAVDGISFNVQKGEIFGFLGPNGAGKTTTIRCLMDFIRPQEGRIEILGQDAHQNAVELKKKIGYLSGQVRLYDHWNGKEHISLVAKLNGNKDIAQKLIKRLDFDTSKKAKTLSSGNRQKLGLIMAFMTEPEVMIFDEPTNALDPLPQNIVYKMFQEVTDKGTTVFTSSHNLAEVQKVCDRVAIIKNGQMVTTESIASLKEKKINTVRAYFGEDFDLNDFKFKDVEIIRTIDHELLFKVKGEINEIVKALAKYRIKDLEITEASLEDIFLEYYE